jgi:hypothetical protein
MPGLPGIVLVALLRPAHEESCSAAMKLAGADFSRSTLAGSRFLCVAARLNVRR